VMLCPECLGRGDVPVNVIAPSEDNDSSTIPYGRRPCAYPGCHGGYLHCCEGLREQPDEELGFMVVPLMGIFVMFICVVTLLFLLWLFGV